MRAIFQLFTIVVLCCFTHLYNETDKDPFFIKDAVDDVIEKVLQNGGDAPCGLNLPLTENGTEYFQFAKIANVKALAR